MIKKTPSFERVGRVFHCVASQMQLSTSSWVGTLDEENKRRTSFSTSNELVSGSLYIVRSRIANYEREKTDIFCSEKKKKKKIKTSSSNSDVD